MLHLRARGFAPLTTVAGAARRRCHRVDMTHCAPHLRQGGSRDLSTAVPPPSRRRSSPPHRSAQALDGNASLSGHFGQPLGVATPGPVRVHVRDKAGTRSAGDVPHCVLERGDRPRPDAAADGNVERVSATAIDRSQAQRVDWRLGDGEPADTLPCRSGTAWSISIPGVPGDEWPGRR